MLLCFNTIFLQYAQTSHDCNPFRVNVFSHHWWLVVIDFSVFFFFRTLSASQKRETGECIRYGSLHKMGIRKEYYAPQLLYKTMKTNLWDIVIRLRQILSTNTAISIQLSTQKNMRKCKNYTKLTRGLRAKLRSRLRSVPSLVSQRQCVVAFLHLTLFHAWPNLMHGDSFALKLFEWPI